MKRFKDCSYRIKLLIVFLSVVLMVVLAITSALTFTASRRAMDSHMASLDLLCDQSLINFSTKVDAIRQHLYTMTASTGTPQQMAAISGVNPGSNNYLQMQNDLIVSLSRIIDSNAMYDHVSVRVEGNGYFSCDSHDRAARAESEQLLMDERYIMKTYGDNTWVRVPSGALYLLRDVYATQPLRYVGRIAARVRQDMLASLGTSNETLHCTMLFYDKEGTFITSTGYPLQDLPAAPEELPSLLQDGDPLAGQYAVCRKEQGGCQAIALLPMSVVNEVGYSIRRTSIIIAAVAMALSAAAALIFSRAMTKKLTALTLSMNRVASGELNVEMPVESRDEIGTLTLHFNAMTKKIRELLNRLIQEEKDKQQAEYQNLEYEYRFLQWQINPHFIYNALETVNGLAKLQGGGELCDMIGLLSDYFRKNAEIMRRKYVPVKNEFRSLKQYSEIYRHIYGDTFEVIFAMRDGTSGAYIPSMIIQPLLENALVHGMSSEHFSHIELTADKCGSMLRIEIRDDGIGMTQEMISKILSPQQPDQDGYQGKTSLGVRNVLERLHLLYGDDADMTINSTLHVGTTVRIILPLSFEVPGQSGS